MQNEDLRKPSIAGELLISVIRENLLDIFLNAPSLPLTLCLRRNVGFRVLKPWVLYLSFILVNAASWLSLIVGNQTGAVLLTALNFVFLGLGIYWRRVAWQTIRRGDRWHTRSRGVSYLSLVLKLPEHIVQRFVEPGAAMFLGLLLLPKLPVVGAWLIASAICLLILEQAIYDFRLNAMLDQHDAMIDSEVAEECSAHFAGSAAKAPTLDQTAGIMVTVAPELEEAIETRRTARASGKVTGAVAHP